MSRPLVHANGAIIWVRQGKGSREMHMPAVGEDVVSGSGHIQYSNLPTDWKWPYNMDRDDGDGGEWEVKPSIDSQGYVHNWAGGQTIIGNSQGTLANENPLWPGKAGAFGMLSPEEEQFYCSMAWPYKGGAVQSFIKAGRQDLADKAATLSNSLYKGKKVLVYSLKTGKGCVCTPGDWGTQPYWSNGAVSSGIKGYYIGLSPDTHWALGTDHGDEFILGWVDDNAPLGPYSVTGSSNSPSTAVSTTPVTISAIKKAGGIVLNHPNNKMGSNAELTELLTSGITRGDSAQVIYKEGNKHFLAPALLNYLWLIFEGGFILSSYGESIRNTTTASGRASLHNHGGAIDIFGLGSAADNKIYGSKDSRWRAMCDQLFSYLASLRVEKPTEVASSFTADYSKDFHVYTDPNPTHLHFGFNKDQASRIGLLPALMK
jgi:hypothetical protein